MHVHSIVATLPDGHGLSTESVLEMWSKCPRVVIMNGAETGITTTAEVMEFARDMGGHGEIFTKYLFGKMV